MVDENYEFSLHATAGATNAKLKFYDNGEVECELDKLSMGKSRSHYHLYGKHEPFSDVYGWMRIHRVEVQLPPSAISIPIEALGCELIYEYIKLPRSSFLQHPEDMLWVSAHWNEFFDLILFPTNFVLQCFDSLKYSIAEGILEEVYPAETRVHITDIFVEHLMNLVVDLDKMKFTKIDGGKNFANGTI